MIMTVRGPIEEAFLGRALAHEHILCDFSGAEETSKSKYSQEEVIRIMLPFLESVRNYGFSSFFDCTPKYIGRDVEILYRLSEESGLNIVTNTGYYGAANDKFIPRFAYDLREEDIANLWIDEWKEGIEDTSIKPGFIKTGVDPYTLSEIDKKLIIASAITHLKTGLTIACHTGERTCALEVLNTVRECRVSPTALVIVHADSIEEKEIIFKLAEEGCWIEYDSIGSKPIEFHVGLIMDTIKCGFASQLLLSHDAGWYTVGESRGGESKIRPYTYISEFLIPRLIKEGLAEEFIHSIFVDNPARAFSISVRRF
ncbi:MAG: aryldialkylphosphatase [bacterium]|nr:aryldialkylphosphatase [bacterium]